MRFAEVERDGRSQLCPPSYTLAQFTFQHRELRDRTVAPETKHHIARQDTFGDEHTADSSGASTKSVAHDGVATFRCDDDPNPIRARCAAVSDEVVSNTLIPTSNHMAKIARFNNPVATGEH